MRILVTGSEGFIGKHLRAALEAMGHEAVRCDIKIGQDIRWFGSFEAKQRYDAVYHLAAITDAQSQDADAVFATNVIPTMKFMKCFGDRLIFASSAMINYPSNAYAISKLAGEMFANVHGAHVLRLPNVYGPGGHSVVDAFREATHHLSIRGNGRQLRTYAPVEDAVREFVNLLSWAGNSRRQVKILGGEDLTVNDVAQKWGRGLPRVHVEASKADLAYAPQLTFDEEKRWAS